MVNYSNGKIYKIWSATTDYIYIGSTTKLLSRRLADHKSSYKRYNEGTTIYTSSFEILEYADAKIELIENFPCNSKEELCKKEGELIRQYKDICVNMRVEGRTQTERDKMYYEEHKEQIAKRQKKYREEHKEQMKIYKEEHKEQIAEKNKIYYEDNKEQIAEKNKKYYEDNKNKLLQPYNCICGSTIRYSQKTRHFRTDKHNQYLQDNLLNLLDL